MLRLRTALALIPGSTLVLFSFSYDIVHPVVWIDDRVLRRAHGQWISTAMDTETALKGRYDAPLAVLPYGQSLKEVPLPSRRVVIREYKHAINAHPERWGHLLASLPP